MKFIPQRTVHDPIETISIFLFVSRRVCFEGEGSRISWILATVNSNVFQPGKDNVFVKKQKFNENQFLRFYFTLTLGIISKNWNFLATRKVSIFVFSFLYFPFISPTILWRSTLCWCARFTQCQTKIKLFAQNENEKDKKV